MPGFSQATLGVGSPATLDFVSPPTTAAVIPGKLIWADNAYLGGGAFIYAKSAASQVVGQCVYFGNANGSLTATAIPNTAGQGFPVGFARQVMAGSDWGWYQVFGICPAKITTGVAVGANIGITGAGTLGTVANGKQILNCNVVGAATDTITKSGTTFIDPSNIRKVVLGDINGLWVGQAVSGTGIGASAKIASIDPSGNVITLDTDSTAAGTVTVTFTYTGFNLLRIAFPFAQGQVV